MILWAGIAPALWQQAGSNAEQVRSPSKPMVTI